MDRTGNITISFLTVYGDRMADTIVSIDPAHMVFSSPLSATDIGGAKVTVTILPPTIGFIGADNVSIEAHETEIHPLGASLSFSSNPKWAGPLAGIATVIPGIFEFYLDTANYEISASTTNIVCPVPKIKFEGPTDLSLEGYSTIITPEISIFAFEGCEDSSFLFINIQEGELILGPSPVFNFKKEIMTGDALKLIPYITYINDFIPAMKFVGSENISIEAHSTTLQSTPAEFIFQDGSFIPAVANGEIIGLCLFEPSSVFGFKSSDITIDVLMETPVTDPPVEGFKRSITLNAGLNFFASTPWVYFPDAFIESALPFFRLEGELSFQIGYEILDANLPSLTILIAGGAHLSCELPIFSLINFSSYNLPSDFITVIPTLSFESYSGNRLKGELPLMPTFSSLATVSIEGNFVGHLPNFSISGTLSIVSDGDFVITIPSFRNNMFALTGKTADLLLKHPFLQLSFQAVTGEIGQIIGDLPKINTRITSVITGPSHISITMKPITLNTTDKGLSTEILRYYKDRIR